MPTFAAKVIDLSKLKISWTAFLSRTFDSTPLDEVVALPMVVMILGWSVAI
jgi:hypothetical protein